MMGKLAVIETLAQSIYFTSYWKVLVLFFCCRSLALPTAPVTSSITTGPGWPASASPMQPSGKCRPIPKLCQGVAQILRCSLFLQLDPVLCWNCWGFTDHPSSERNIKCTVNKNDQMWMFITSLPQRWNFGTALFLGAEGLLLSYIICEMCRLLQFALICLYHLECYIELQRELLIINMQIFIPLKSVRVLAWMGQDYTWGSVHVAVWKLPLNCLFFHPVKTGALNLRLV